ncbi:BMP family ABC transporter substrate-binding protein [Faecalibacterium sp. AM43-5AT]|uniref:BMP family ABC transporter substrate-binding protein n=1 Tax=Faecalibacterium sp. AM43-5AT TaxID=2302957 RepID=UPI000E75C9C0|nr:BMP family ABC transporter substrate-binding protein [Faecalibacterium sp. AM43-5AT]RJV96122.1 BMP family ABC transporter substrate-binding protein [Faecalibacterium sp. AM43-5AT]
MLEDYKNALKSGQRAYRACVARGQSPYLAVLDDILVNVNIVAQEPLGLVEIPAESIVGTKTSGRHTAFAPNFMPLLEPDTEFAGKWSNLCDAHLEEGIHTPIIAYEFLNKFYVQEGNKRVSVLKYFDAVRIAGTVTRLVPERNDSLENRIYYEFLDFYKLSKVNDVHFSRLGGYAKLQTLVCKASGESWTDDDRLSFSAFYTMFRQQFLALGGGGLNLTAGDAMLVYLSVYRYADACESTPSQMKQNLEKLWDEVKVLTEPQAVALSLEPKQGPGEPLLAKLNIFTKPSELKVVFLHEHNAENSAWVRAHDKGIEALQQAFPDRVFITRKENIEPEVDAEQVLEDVAHDNADVVFTSSARMHTACLKVAAQHPKTRILNCSLNAPHPLVRTYYPRTYEVTYLLGMLAGVMARTDRVGYVAANPVYGIPAAVNAYAQGLKTVRPDAKVVLRWACLPDPAHPLDFSDRPDVEIFYARDNREPEGTHRDYGLCRRQPDGTLQPLGLPVWRWDTFYTEIIRSIFDGAWDNDAAGARAVNYWWGMRSGAEEIDYSKDLPAGTLQLLDLMEKMLSENDLRIFPEDLYAQGHVLHSPEAVVYSPKELMEMDWLDECVEGALPHYDELDVKTHTLMAINGLNTLKGFVK